MVGTNSTRSNYDLQYVQGRDNVLADPLYRLPLTSFSTQIGDKQISCPLLNMRISDLPLQKEVSEVDGR